MWVEFQGSRLLDLRLAAGFFLKVYGLVLLLIPVESPSDGGDTPAADAGSPVEEFVGI